MKKQFTVFLTIIFLAFGCFFFASSTYAETEVSGNITSDITWALANSPYIVTGTVQVLQGAKLTIEPGVIVKFNIEAGLINDGELIAIGFVDQNIVFTSNQPTPKSGDWGTISFYNNAIASTFDNNDNYLAGSAIKYCKIEFGGGQGSGNNAGVINNFSSKSFFISNSIIANNNSSGIDMRNSIITNNIIRDNRLYGIKGGLLIKGNLLENNSTGLYIDGGKITNNIIRNNRDVGIEIASSNPSATYNNITNNTSYNIRLKYNVVPNGISIPYNYFGSIDKNVIDDLIYDYFDYTLQMGKVIYEPYALAELKFDGTDTFSQLPTCTSWTYSSWGTCTNGQQTRTITSSQPTNCTGGNPVLTQSCTVQSTVCSSWTYSNWSACQSNNTQTRTVTSLSPSSCSGGNPVLTQSCSYVAPTCISWAYSNWSSCTNGQQTRTITSYQPANCTGGNPVLNQSCNSTPLCTENNWASILTPTNCPSNNQQTKKWTKTGQCQGGISHPTEESFSCNYQTPTCANFSYSSWGECDSSGVQSRTILSSSPSSCVGGNPVLTQSCVAKSPACVLWTYSSWSDCTNGWQTRNFISSSPNNCIGGNPVISQPCQGATKSEEKNIDTVQNNSQTTENNITNSSNNGAGSQKVIAEEKKLATKTDNSLAKRMNGNILLQVEKNGEGWYVYPDDKKKYYLGRPADAFSIMRNLGLGIKHNELTKYLNSKFPSKLSGKILLDVEKNGEAYYVNPKDLKGYFLSRPSDAFKVMKDLGLGITNNDIRKIGVGEIK